MSERIYVETVLFEGWAEIIGREDCAFYPIIVRLDTPDYAGHRVFRICEDDITKRSERESV